MGLRRKLYKRMYAVSCEGVGLIAGTLAYSRRGAIDHFLHVQRDPEWGKFKRDGYRTVCAMVKIIEKPSVVR